MTPSRLRGESWRPRSRGLGFLYVLVGILVLPEFAEAARIGNVGDEGVMDRAMRFLSFRDPSVRLAVVGCVLLGLCCGLLGTFIVVRQFALFGDMLAHAVLPGIALGYLWNFSKQPLHLFVGAVVAGLIGAVVVNLIQQTTRLKRDTSLGIVLGGFYGVGILLVTLIQKLPGDKSGLKSFLFGSAAALSEADVGLIAVVTLVSIGLLGILFPYFKVVSFDPTFATSVGIPAKALNYLLMLLLAWAVVSALQAVGVVLVSALLVTPAATAYLLTDRLFRMAILSMGFGMLAGALGAFFSALQTGLPTGPFIVLSASSVFVLAYGFAPRHGLLPRWRRRLAQSRKIRRENTLKAIFHLREREGIGVLESGAVDREALVAQRGRSPEAVDREIRALVSHDLAVVSRGGREVELTDTGRSRAAEIVRNHRLWELYLTKAADIAPDHVHDDAEKIEHVLGEAIVAELERDLDRPRLDPHGKEIPALSGAPSSDAGKEGDP